LTQDFDGVYIVKGAYDVLENDSGIIDSTFSRNLVWRGVLQPLQLCKG
jgi:hypothetical protein